MLKFTFYTMLGVLVLSCSTDPQAINFGEDQCHYCKMAIVDQTHAAQYVTDKGKQFKFDAIECMVNELQEGEPKALATSLVSDYAAPGVMTLAEEATFLISPGIKSPMGAFLTGFALKEVAIQMQKDAGGNLYTWEELKTHFSEK